MKSNFLKQISRMLVFGILITGFPARDVIAGPPICPTLASGATAAATACPLNFNYNKGQGCSVFGSSASTYSAANVCNLNVGSAGSCLSCLSSSNSPTTISNAGITPFANYSVSDTTAAPNVYQTTTNNLLAAIINFTTTLGNYQDFSFLNGAMLDIMGYLLVDGNSYYLGLGTTPDPNNPYGYTVQTLPLVPSTADESVLNNFQYYSYPRGDFLPVNTAAGYSPGSMIASFVNYLANTNLGNQRFYAQVTTALILYSLLSSIQNPLSTPTPNAPYTFSNLASASALFGNTLSNLNPLTGASTVTVRTPAEMVLYLQNADQYSLKPNALGTNLVTPATGTPTITPSGALNLLINLNNQPNINWQAIYADPAQLAVFTNIAANVNTSSAAFQAVFPPTAIDGSAYVAYFANAFKAIANNQIYFRCDQDISVFPAKPMDTSIYFSNNAEPVSVKLSEQFLTTQKVAKVTTPSPLPTVIPDATFNYNTGNFFFWIPSTAQLSGGQGALDLSGMQTPGSEALWNSVCANSSSNSVYAIQDQILSGTGGLKTYVGLATKLTAPENSAPGAALYDASSLEGASYNLLTAASAAINDQPIKTGNSKTDLTSYYSFITSGTYVPTYLNIIKSMDSLVNYKPVALSNFLPPPSATSAPGTITGTAVGTTPFVSYLNELSDIVAIRNAYSDCWVNLSICASTPNPANSGSGTDCYGTYSPDINTGLFHIHDGLDFFSGRCFNKALGEQVEKAFTSLPSLIVMGAFIGIPALFGIFTKAAPVPMQKLQAWLLKEDWVDPATLQKVQTMNVSKGAEDPYVKMVQNADMPSAPISNPVAPVNVSNSTFQELQQANLTNESQLNQFAYLDQGAKNALRTSIQQQLIDLKAQVEDGVAGAEEELDQAKTNAEKYNQIEGNEDDPIEIPE